MAALVPDHAEPVPYQLEPAHLSWGEDNVPRSVEYGDVYYSREHGLDETRYVFIENNHLTERWQNTEQALFRIGETGFGTGLNFLASWQHWETCVAQNPNLKTLQYVSVEKHPLTKQDLEKALALWPDLAAYSHALLAQYPPLVRGHHRLHFECGKTSIILDLLFDEAELGFDAMRASKHPFFVKAGPKIDAWYLDGFAPGTNPGMWTDALFDIVASLSNPETSFATFTAAGFVRRSLRDRGFVVEKVQGFGSKRDMLRGRFEGLPENTENPQYAKRKNRIENAAWHLSKEHLSQEHLLKERLSSIKHIAVIGAGLAGCHTARALARRGYPVTVIEQSEHIAGAASGNPQGILYTKLSHRDEPLARFALSSFLFALRQYRQQPELPGDLCGVIQLSCDDQLTKLREGFGSQQDWCQFVNAQDASRICGLTLDAPAIFYPLAGWLRPAALCQQLIQHELITTKTATTVHSLREDTGGGWILDTSAGDLSADVVIIANAYAATSFTQTAALPLRTVRGQLSYLHPESFEAIPKTVICHDGYLAPPVDGQMVIGASYDLKSTSVEIRKQEHHDNIEKLKSAIPGLKFFNTEVTGGRAALRCTSPDYLPLVGAVPIHTRQQATFSGLAKDAKSLISEPGQYYRGLYVNLAHGSRGLTSTPLCAEILASQIRGELAPVSRSLVQALSPSRFLIRNLIRGKLAQTAL